MADCSELAQAIDEMIDLVTEQLYQTNPNVNFDDVVAEMIARFPRLDRTIIKQAIIETHTRKTKEADTLKKVVKSVRGQARTEIKMEANKKKVTEYLDKGMLPKTKEQTKATNFTLEQLRKTNQNLNKWLKSSDPVMKEKLTKRLQALQTKVESGEIEIEDTGKFHDVLQPLLDQVKDARTQVRDAKELARLQDMIDKLEQHLKEGTLPAKQKRETREHTEAYNALKEIADDLKDQIKNSNPAQKEKLQKQLDTINEKLKSGDIMPVKREKMSYDDPELEKMQFQIEHQRSVIRNKIYDMQPRTLWGTVGDVFDFDRLVQTTGEFSLTFAQLGMYYFSRPIRLVSDTIESFKAFADPIYCAKVTSQILNDVDAPMVIGKMKVHISPVEGAALSPQEEAYMGKWSSRIPVIRNFTRAGVTIANLARYSMGKSMYHTLGINGKMEKGQAEFLGKAVNEMTGRGTTKTIEQNAVLLNRAFYSARFWASRFQIAMFHPIWSMPFNSEVSVKARLVVVSEYARFIGALLAFYGLSSLAGGEPEWEPKDKHFMQIKFGSNYIDPTIGLGKLYSLATISITGEKIDSDSEKTTKLTPYTRGTEVLNYFRGKLAPLPSVIADLLIRETIDKKEVTLPYMAKKVLLPTPITYDDIYKMMKEEGGLSEEVALSFLTMFGIRMQTMNNEQGIVSDIIEKTTGYDIERDTKNKSSKKKSQGKTYK